MAPERQYVNDAAINAGKHDIALNLGYQIGDEAAEVVAAVVFSREFLPLLVDLLKKELT